MQPRKATCTEYFVGHFMAGGILKILLFFVVFLSTQNIHANPPITESPVPSTRKPTESPFTESVASGEAVVEDFIDRYQTTNLVDLIFVLDRSGSVPPKGWGAVTNFIRDILQHFTVDQHNTRVAIVTYSSEAIVDINDLEPRFLSSLENKCTLNRRIKELIEPKIPYGYTSTYAALDNVYEIIQDARNNSKKAVLVLTDGRSNVGPPPVKAAFNILSLKWDLQWDEALFGPQVEIYAFGIEEAYIPELRSIASAIPNHTFLIPSFEAFEDFARSLHGGKQKETWISTRNSFECGACSGVHAQCMCGAKSGEYACLCGPGFQRINSQCVECSRGYYKESFSLDACIPCPENTTTEYRASTSADKCHLMPGMRECPVLDPVPNGYLFYAPGSRFDETAPTKIPCLNVKDGNSCHHACNEGYWLDGSPVMICKDTGQWQGTPPTCRVVDCGPIENQTGWRTLVNAEITLLNNTTVFGSVIDVTCLANTVPLGSTTWTCDRHGQWTKPWNFQCATVYCGPVPHVDFMKTSPADCATSKQEYRTECHLVCKDGFELIGVDKLQCGFNRKPVWEPTEVMPYCKDVLPPAITCPHDMTNVMVAQWGDNSTVVHIDEQDALVEDNSNNYTVEVQGVPAGMRFPLGSKAIKYIAKDAAGNTNFCQQSIQVTAKTAEPVRCPNNTQKVMDSANNEVSVEWEHPIFIDDQNNTLEFQCSHSMKSFSVGTHAVECNPILSGYKLLNVKCSFNVVIAEPACDVLYMEKLPRNGALVCGRPRDDRYPKVCRVHCKEKYRLRLHDYDHQFKCGWDGQWIKVDGWPDCYRVRPPTIATTVNDIHVAYTGDCQDKKSEIESAFTISMEKLVQDSGECNEAHVCTVVDVEVWCGARRRRRNLDDSVTQTALLLKATTTPYDSYDTLAPSSGFTQQSETRTTGFNSTVDSNIVTVTSIPPTTVTAMSTAQEHIYDTTPVPPRDMFLIRFTLKGEIANKSETEVTADEQKTLTYVLDDAYYYIEEHIEGWSFATPDGENVTAATIDTVTYTKLVVNCSAGEAYEENYNRKSAFCVECPPGSFELNATCLPCDTGYFQDEPGQTTCKKCPQNMTTQTTGSRDSCDCTENEFGDFGNETGIFRNETEGALAAASHSKQCYTCPAIATNRTCSESTQQKCGPVCIHGECSVEENHVKCECFDGYTGDKCDSQLDPCWNITCRKNGTCRVGDDGFICDCDAGFVGPFCEQAEYSCESDPCFHGYCLEILDSYNCVCDNGWTGFNCDVTMPDCLSDPCHHGNCSVSNGGIVCHCEEGFYGPLCEYEIDVCSLKPCHHNGTCVTDDGRPFCFCQHGWTGVYCEDEVDPCTDHDCYNNGSCQHGYGYFMCKCRPGFAGPNCEKEIGTNFDLVYPRGSVEDFVSLRPFTASLKELTACLWLRTSDAHRFGTIFSYAVPSDFLCVRGPDSFTLYDYGMLKIFVNGDSVNTRFALNNGRWHHVCVTWSAVKGTWSLLVNGTVRARGYGLAVNTTVEQRGYLLLGQRQVTAGNAYNSRSSFIGEMHQLNIFDHVLTGEEMKDLAETTNSDYEGAVLNWASVTGHVNGDVLIRNTSWCHDVNECLDNNVCGVEERCIDELGSYRCEDISADPCESLSCYNNGQCIIGQNGQLQCSCLPGYTGRQCELMFSCDWLLCENNGTCSEEGGAHCVCPPSYHGDHCEEMSDPCDNAICHNDGVCKSFGNQYKCTCKGTWKGKHCQTIFTPSCANSPCLNNGTCVLDPSTAEGYKCECGADNMGPNCEVLPCLSNPCDNKATCKQFDSGYECICASGFAGEHCEYHVTTTAETPSDATTSLSTSSPVPTKGRPTPLNRCLGVECEHGDCVNDPNGFYCECDIDFKGPYCQTKRPVTTRTYQVRLTLLRQYTNSLQYNETFKRELSNAIHDLYRPKSSDSKLRIDIVNLLPGSVIVDLDLIHTVYSDGTALGSDAMKETLQGALLSGRLGHLRVSLDNFSFKLKSAVRAVTLWWEFSFSFKFESAVWVDTPWWGWVLLAVAIVAVVATVAGVWTVCKKRRHHSKPCKLNNSPDNVRNKIKNPMFGASGLSPQAIRMLPHEHEEIYSEPIEMPYAVTSFSEFDNAKNESGEDSLGTRFPSKRGKDINKDWATGGNRHTMPLPPRPDEAPEKATQSLSDPRNMAQELLDHHYKQPKGTKVTPAPTYKDAISKNLKMSNANINPSFGATDTSKYGSGGDSLYITPVSDDDTKLAGSPPPGAVGTVPSIVVDSEDAYLTPRHSRVASDHESDDGYTASENQSSTDERLETASNLRRCSVEVDVISVGNKPSQCKPNQMSDIAQQNYLPMATSRSRPGSASSVDYLTPVNVQKPGSDLSGEDVEYLQPIASPEAHVYVNDTPLLS